MSQKKFLDKIGLQNFLNRIKALIPTKTSELQNDSGFITSEGTYDSALSLESEKAVQNKVVTAAINGKQDTLSTAQTNAVDSGITSAKVQGYDSHISDTDIHVTQADKTSWDSKAPRTHTHLASEVSGLSTVATSGSYNDLSNKPSIPSKTSDLTNDSGFLTSHNPVDSALSSTSTNAVQNKVINTELGKKANTTDLATVATSGSYNDLSNKPTIPTVNNATLTIQKNGTTVKTFTANSSTNVTADITVPTKVSELTNDSGFLTSHNPVDSALSTTSENAVQNKVVKAELDNKANSADLSTVATTGSYADLNNIPSNFTPASHTHGSITNDGKLGTASRALITDGNKKIAVSSVTSTELGYLSGVTSAVQDQLDSKAASTHSHTASEVSGLATVATSGSYNDLTNKPTIPTVNNATLTIQKNGTTVKTFTSNASSNVTANITVPTKVSELTNDSGFLTSHNPVDSALSDTSTNAVQNKVVKGALDGKSDTGHTHTASEVSGLSTVATSGSYNDLSNKPTIPTVNNATLTIQKNGSTVKTFTANASSNVTANITVPTKVSELTNDSGFLTSASNLDSSKLTGTIDIARLPKGALERLVTVADQTARFALTTSDVQLGDTVKQLDTGVMYIVTDESSLSSADGYTEYTAGAATSVPWSGVTGKPSSYTPASHSHGNIANGGTLGTASRALITDGNKKITTSSVTSTELGYLSGVTSAVQTQLNGKAASSHTHTASEVSGLSTVATSGSYNDLSNKPTIDTALSSTSTNAVQNKVINTALAGKAASSHTHTKSQITDFPTKTSQFTNDSHQTITVGTDTTSTASPAHSGTFTCIDSVTRDSNGHVTAVNTKTVTLPADNNTDTKVTNTLGTTTKAYVTGTTSATTNTGTQIFDTGVYLSTTAGELVATKFTGALNGNASTATQFSANKDVTLTGDVTGTASSKAGWSVATTLSDSGVTAGTYGPSADVTGNNNATISVPEITVDSKGRVTSVANRTLTCKNNTYNVYNKTLTIQKNGTNVATFTSNSNTDVTANITVPTKTSELTNDSGFLTSHQSLSNYVTLNGTQTISGVKTISAKNVKYTASVTRGTAPSAAVYKQPADYVDSAGNRIFLFETVYNTDKSSKTGLYAYNTTAATGNSIGNISIGCDASGNVYTQAPTPATADNSTKIATTAFVKAQGYLTSHQSLSNYSTLANTVKSLSISGKTITVTPGSGSAYTLTTQDTVYTHPTTSGNKHIPSGGSSGQFLGWASDGTAKWVNNPNTNTDTLMTQNVSTTNATYPILLVATADATANQGAKTGIFAKSVKVNPSTNVISASGFSGPLTGNVTGNCSGSSGSCTGNAATATKLATARSISLGNEFAGSANFDGSGNITVNANAYLSVVGVGNKNNYPYHRFAYFGPITSQYTDAAIRLQVARQCINGGSGILEIEFRTNATNGDGQCDVRWIVRSSKLPVDCIQIGFFKTWGGIYADVFCKSTGAYDSYVIRSMGDGSRGSYERKFTLQDCSEANNTTTSDPLTSVNSYASIAAAGTALHNQAYTDILTAADAGVVETANTCSGNSATASKVVATVANDNTGALVQGTMGSNDCFRIAIGGASNAGWAEIATGDDYNEPIYVRQYQGSFTTLKRTATLLDASGNTSFPGTVTATGFSGPLTGNVTGNCSGSSGSCTGNAATATQFSANKSVTLTGDVTGTASSKAGWSVATTLANSGVTAGTYGPSADVTGNNNATISVPEITVDAKGRVTSVTNRTLTCKNNTYNVYNKTLTIQKNGTNVATFTSNSNTDVTANITVPTKTSELTNDSGYLTSHQSLSNYVTLNSAQTITGAKTFSGLTKTAGKTEQSSPSNLNDALYNVETYPWGTSTTNKPSSSYGILLNLNREGNVHSSTSNGWRAQLGVGTDTRLYLRTKANTGGEWSAWKEFLTSHQSLSNYSTLANTIKSLSISGKTITYTKGDNTTGTLTTQDTNTDTLMTQNVSTTNATYPVLLVATADATANQGAKTGIFAKSVKVNPSTNVISASGFSGPLTGNVTGNCSGTAANVTGTVAIANGGTGATSRLNAVKALTNENVGTAATYFLGITNSWGKAGYISVADARTVLEIPTFAFQKFAWEETITLSSMASSSEWAQITGGFKYTANVSLKAGQLTWIYVYLITSNDLIKITITNGYILSGKNCVDDGKNSIKADTTTYGSVLTQTVCGSSRLNCLFYPYNSTVTLTMTYTTKAHAGGEDPTLSGKVLIKQ